MNGPTTRRTSLLSVWQPESGTTTYTYYPAGNLQTVTDAKSQVTTYYYDGNDRLTSIDSPDSNYSTTVTYDESNNRRTINNGYVHATFDYDDGNRLISRTDIVNNRTFITQYEPDDNGNVARITYPSGNHVRYYYDAGGRISSVFDDVRQMTFASDLSYHPSGALSGYWSGDGVPHGFSYDARGRLEHLTAGTTTTPVLDLTYSDDYVGNVSGILDPRTDGPGNATFGYDSLDRMTSATANQTARNGWGTVAYGYDPIGNRRSKTHNSVETTYAFGDSHNRLTATSGGDNEPALLYDNNGNLTSDSRAAYTYTPTNMLETATILGTALYTYRYDGDNQRVEKIQGGLATTYYLRGVGDVLSEFEEQGGHLAWMVDYVYAGGRLLAGVRPSFGVVVTKTGAGTGTVAASPSGVDCGATCSASYPLWSEVTLTAVAGSGAVFAGWSGACTGTATTSTIRRHRQHGVHRNVRLCDEGSYCGKDRLGHRHGDEQPGRHRLR